jgi:flavin reductase (DIM6/NTAB) family NADH-FMN oxidoreductase RutF
MSDPPELAPAASSERFREIFRHWAASVALVAVRDEGRAYGTTVTSLTPVAAEPATVLISLGPTAQVLPFLEPGRPFAVSLLARDQGRIAEIYADAFPVGAPPFPAEGDPVIAGSMGGLLCVVDELFDTRSGTRLVLGRVVDGWIDPSRAPLLFRRRKYLGVEPEAE